MLSNRVASFSFSIYGYALKLLSLKQKDGQGIGLYSKKKIICNTISKNYIFSPKIY